MLKDDIQEHEKLMTEIHKIELPYLEEIEMIKTKMEGDSLILKNKLDFLTTKIRAEISNLGESYQTDSFNYTFVKPSMIFDKTKLMELAKVHPEILNCQKQKSGCVKINKRKIKQKKKSEPGIFD